MRKGGRKTLLWLGAMAIGATLVFSPMTAKAAGVPIDKDHFPDRIFREYVQKNFDTNGDKSLSGSEIKVVKEVDVYNRGIESLKGIENFTNLQSLTCCYNYLTSLDLGNNTQLTYLNCYENRLTDLDVRKNPLLKELYCNENKIKNLDVSNNPGLTILECSENELAMLDITKNPDLESLNCRGNQLKTLNVSTNTKLTLMIIGTNNIKKIDLSNNTNLMELFCGQNELTELNLKKNPKLLVLSCYDNQLSTLDVSNQKDLITLWCTGNKLTSLDLSNNTALETFDEDSSGNGSFHNYDLSLPIGVNTFDLTTLPGRFNVKYAKNWKGGTVSGNILTATADKVTYTYDCGNGYSIEGTLNIKHSVDSKLSTPVITKLENASTGVKVTWGAVKGAEMYRLMYKEPGGTFKTGGYTTGTSYTVKNLESGVEYAFTVRCMTADKKANTSDYDRIGTTIKYIAAPAISKVTNASNGVKVEWAASAGAELYKVMYKEAGGSYKTAGYTTDTSYTVTGLTSGTEYTFTARCMTADKKTYTSSYNSKGLSIVYKPAATKLATPVITKLENTASGVKVTWGAVEGAEMYRLMYKEPDGTFKTGGYTTGTSYTVKNLTGGVTYAFTVRCMTADKKASTSDYDKMGTSITYITQPVLKKVTNTASGVKVTWEASAGAELYKVMYMEKDGTWKTGGYTTGTSYTVKKLTEGTEYAFTVRCMTADKSAYTSGYDKVGLSIRFGN